MGAEVDVNILLQWPLALDMHMIFVGPNFDILVFDTVLTLCISAPPSVIDPF